MKRTIKVGRNNYEYLLICSRTRNKLLLQALPEGKIRLYAPAGIALKTADRFVLDNIDSIIKAHKRFEEASKKRAACSLPDTLRVEGVYLPVQIQKTGRNRVSFQKDFTLIETVYNTDQEITGQLKRALTELALCRFRYYLEKWGPTIGISYGRVTVREQKTRWGSCSSKLNLNFNWKLIMAPTQALEYVVIHELCHLIHFNHSVLFWKEVESRMPDYEIWKAWLKKNGRLLTLG